MRTGIIIALVAVCCMTASSATAGSTVSIRLVEARKHGPANENGIGDVIGILRKSTSYDHFALVSSTSHSLPAKGKTSSLGGYSVKTSGAQDNLTITVTRRGKRLLTTTVSLKDGKPVILGGFPSKLGKMMFVFVAR